MVKPKPKDLYELWHRRFAHMGKKKLKNLHEVTTLQRAIQEENL